ncbi:MAG: hypothetical protein HDR41_00220 [Lactobacillus sp.]|nr:hypothetical protein [Lactobacillus sp.]
MVKFVKDGKKYNIELNGENYGELTWDEDQSAWVLWSEDIDDGVTYYEDLQETKDEIIDELLN